MSKKIITVTAPPKINLVLKVLGLRKDGFHELNLYNTKLRGLDDTITFEEAEELSFHCEDPHVPQENNSVLHATRLYSEAANVPCLAKVTLVKKIPSGAGLGGGSSDAASTLRAWNEWHGDLLDEKTLHELAEQIGSDVPFFLGGNTARCAGKGQLVIPMKDPLPTTVVLFKPEFPVNTADAYRRWKEEKGNFLPGVLYEPQHSVWGETSNMLEKTVFAKFPFLAEIKMWLLGRPEVSAAMMSGSGSTVFAVLHPNASSENLIALAKEKLDPHLWAHECKFGRVISENPSPLEIPFDEEANIVPSE